MPNKSLLDMNMKDLQIIYKNNKPYGIRDKCGYLLFFCEIQKWTGQGVNWGLTPINSN